MKLRVHNNALRLRLTVSEVAAVGAGRSVVARVAFPGGAELSYRLDPADVSTLTAGFEGSAVVVRVPRARGADWARDEQAVSLEARHPLEDGNELVVLVEKDFACLVPREGDDAGDLFTHPAAGASR